MSNSLQSILRLVFPAVSIFMIGCGGDGNVGVDTPPPPVPGARLLGTSEYDGAQGLAVDSSGNIFIAGFTSGDLDGNSNAGVNDTFLTKCDSSGIKQWTRLLGGGSNDDLALGIAVDGRGNVYIAGVTAGYYWLDGIPNGGRW